MQAQRQRVILSDYGGNVDRHKKKANRKYNGHDENILP